MISFDPYDLWATPFGVTVRRKYYAGELSGKLAAVAIGVLDWLAPELSRWLINTKPQSYPIVIAHDVLQRKIEHRLREPEAGNLLQFIRSLAVNTSGQPVWAWGLGFPWMSKNGLYGPEVPFVTHTPYVMEALLALSELPTLHEDAMALFQSSGDFLSTLIVMHKGSDDLALSYAPMAESRTAVNANAYAAFAHSLHALHGRPAARDKAREKAILLARWVVRQQESDGSWFYFADRESGNFIDCFHSCFVVKNLIKVKTLLPEAQREVSSAIEYGWSFIRERLYDSQHGLCKRFIIRDIKDPFKWDLYDQAEYLGLLIDFGLTDEASVFTENVEHRFRRGNDWYCRIDIFGRLWGRNFLRWGIAPFWYHRSRLEQLLKEKGNL